MRNVLKDMKTSATPEKKACSAIFLSVIVSIMLQQYFELMSRIIRTWTWQSRKQTTASLKWLNCTLGVYDWIIRMRCAQGLLILVVHKTWFFHNWLLCTSVLLVKDNNLPTLHFWVLILRRLVQKWYINDTPTWPDIPIGTTTVMV